MDYSFLDYLLIIILGFFVAFAPRYLPLLFFSKRQIPKWFNDWMKYVPISLFTALVVKGIFISSSYSLVTTGNLALIIGGLVVVLIAYWTRSMAMSVIVGLATVMILSLII
jgi:branched-subunit amino acid transport protein